MSAVTAQPLPFGRLERERHIEALFRATPQHGGPEHHHQEVESRTVRLVGLELLGDVRQLRVTVLPEPQGPNCVPRRTYSIASQTREQLYVAVEESSCMCLHCCGPARSCSVRGFDRRARHVFVLERPLRIDASCLSCCPMEMRTFSADGRLLGVVRQRWNLFTPLLEVCDSDGDTVARILGSCCPCRCYANQEFQVVSSVGERVGQIWKKWPGYNEEVNMDHECFGLDVPQEMGTNTKALLLAATFLLNYMYFEMS